MKLSNSLLGNNDPGARRPLDRNPTENYDDSRFFMQAKQFNVKNQSLLRGGSLSEIE
jgi:hypothetical protein